MAQVVVNGLAHELGEPGARRVLAFLRSELGLMGAKPGCGEGECGACTVLVDGNPVLSCQVDVGEVEGSSITTIEGLASEGRLHPIQEALVAERASQCGYCTPAMALRAAALLESVPDPDDSSIVSAMDPNLCRCGCYARIVAAVHRAADTLENRGDHLTAHSAAPLLPGLPRALARPSKPWDLCEAHERDWFELLGDGLVSVWPAQKPTPGMWAMNGGAWVHVAPSGLVTAFSGKVDVGQDNRTAFGLVVAEELGVGPEDVQVFLGDTDVCPFDMGTFGSRSMPDAAEALRRAAAGARQFLLGIAVKELGVPTEALSPHGAGTVGIGARADLHYGKLLEGVRHVEVLTAEPPLVDPSSWTSAGSSGPAPPRTDVVTGSRVFVSDIELPDMLHGAVLRPPVRGGALRSCDLGASAKLSGVSAVRDGDLVALAAADLFTARQALGAVVAEWDDPSAGPDDLVEHLRSHPISAEGWEREFEQSAGDVNAALDSAAISLTATYTTAYIAHTPLETRAAVAQWEADKLTVWTGTQVPFGVRSQLAAALRMDETQVRVIVPPTGSAFGGKHGAQVAIEAARLARALGRPVKVHWSRAEEFRWGTLRPMALIDVRAGLDEDGSITAWDFTNINAGAAGIACPYDVPNQRLRYQPAESPLAQASYRALAATANHFARESLVDELAHAAGIEPLDLRLRNLSDDRLVAVAEAGAERFGWPGERKVSGQEAGKGLGARRGPAPGPTSRTGSGLAIGMEKGGRVATFAHVEVDDERIRVDRIVTAYECGAVANRDTVVNQIEGATVMALGGALFEAAGVEGGRFAQPSLSHYRVPRFSDMPAVEVVLLDRREFASAGAGETPMVAVAPAVANAVFAAVGRRLRSLPLSQGLS